MKICIVGGGNLAHVAIGMLSMHGDVSINLLTRHPECWTNEITVELPENKLPSGWSLHTGKQADSVFPKSVKGRIDCVSADPADVVPGCDIVLLCLPAFLVEETVIKLAEFVDPARISDNNQSDASPRPVPVFGTIVANSGFFIFCHNHLSPNTKLFGFQRVPYMARVSEYGKSAKLLGFHDELFMATENIPDQEAFRMEIARLFMEKVSLVGNFYEVTLSNSNPILHTGRLYTMFGRWDGNPFDRCSFFYKEWTDEASELEIGMDREFFSLLKALKVNTTHIDTLLEHYEAVDASGMTRKLRSIEALSTILSPMKQVDGGWIPDFNSRYFTEDFPFGLKLIKDLCAAHGLSTPNIDKVLDWGLQTVRRDSHNANDSRIYEK